MSVTPTRPTDEIQRVFRRADRQLHRINLVADGVSFTAEEREFIADSLAKVRGLLTLIEVQL